MTMFISMTCRGQIYYTLHVERFAPLVEISSIRVFFSFWFPAVCPLSAWFADVYSCGMLLDLHRMVGDGACF